MLKFYFKFNLRITGHKKTPPAKVKYSKTKSSFREYAQKEILNKRKSHSYSTSRNYRTALNSFMKFLDGRDISFCKIDSLLMEEYQKWLKNNNVSLNTISCYMRSLRAIYNRAVDNGQAVQQYPFKKVFTGIEKSCKRSISKEDIYRLRSLKLRPGSYVCLVRDIFLFSFYACGIPFVDIAHLKKSQISKGYLTYTRQKTRQKIRILLEPCMTEILDKYMSEDREYIFPIINSQDKEIAYRQYRNGIGRYNKGLKLLEKKCGNACNLSSYVARHTWASLAYQSNIELPVISKALGHTTSKTTFTYIKEINDKTLELANRIFLDKILDSLPPLYKNFHS